jgi:RNA polymerase sigma factor (sigma-70 family)
MTEALQIPPSTRALIAAIRSSSTPVRLDREPEALLLRHVEVMRYGVIEEIIHNSDALEFLRANYKAVGDKELSCSAVAYMLDRSPIIQNEADNTDKDSDSKSLQQERNSAIRANCTQISKLCRTVQKHRETDSASSAAEDAKELLKLIIITRLRDTYLERAAEIAKLKKGNNSHLGQFQLARSLVVKVNHRLVRSAALRFANRGLDDLDLEQYGRMGILTALDRFVLDRGFRFPTFAESWVKQSILRAIAKQSEFILTPEAERKILKRVSKLCRERMQIFGVLPTSREIATTLNITVRQVEDALNASRSVRSLDETIGGTDDLFLIDVVPDRDATTQDQQLMQDEMHNLVAQHLGSLSPLEQNVLRRHFGIGCPEQDWTEIAKELSMPKNRLRGVEDKALRKLRNSSRELRQLLV